MESAFVLAIGEDPPTAWIFAAAFAGIAGLLGLVASKSKRSIRRRSSLVLLGGLIAIFFFPSLGQLAAISMRDLDVADALVLWCLALIAWTLLFPVGRWVWGAVVLLCCGAWGVEHWEWRQSQRGGPLGPFDVERVVWREEFDAGESFDTVTEAGDGLLLFEKGGPSLLDDDGQRVPVAGDVPLRGIRAALHHQGRHWFSVPSRARDGSEFLVLFGADLDGQQWGSTSNYSLPARALWDQAFVAAGSEVRLAVATTAEPTLEESSVRVQVALLGMDATARAEWSLDVRCQPVDPGAVRSRGARRLPVTITACGEHWLAVATPYDLWLLRHGANSLGLEAHATLVDAIPLSESIHRDPKLSANSSQLAVGLERRDQPSLLRVYGFGRDGLRLQHEASLGEGEDVSSLALAADWLARIRGFHVVVHPLTQGFATATPVARGRDEGWFSGYEYLTEIAVQGDLLVSLVSDNPFYAEWLSVDRIQVRGAK
jgi:hypothetical protein